MGDLLAWLEASLAGRFMRGTGVWTYAVVNLTHILGISALFGCALVLDLRLAGVWRGIPLASLTGPTVRVARIGFFVAAVTGVFLLATKATEYAGNPFFWWMKLPAIACAVVNVAMAHRTVAWREHHLRELTSEEERGLQRFGVASLCFWFVAMVGGRMTAYW